MEVVHSIHNSFRLNLTKYVNDGTLSRADKLLALIFPPFPFYKNAAQIIKQSNYLPRTLENSKLAESIEIRLEPYAGTNSYALKMHRYLSANLSHELIGAYVHGSLGNYEDVAYSDFDALIILKSSVFHSKSSLFNIAWKLSLAQSIMFDFDPLQHHGWFILTEADLSSYPEYYLPLDVFKHAKSLLPDRGLALKINLQKSIKQNIDAFTSTSSSIFKCIDREEYPQNIYRLKALLSQFMMMPALYVQVRDKRGVFKKYSFDAAKADFTQEEWSIMDEVSHIRNIWHYPISPLRRYVMAKPCFWARRLAKVIAPKIPSDIDLFLTRDFFQRMRLLVARMGHKLR